MLFPLLLILFRLLFWLLRGVSTLLPQQKQLLLLLDLLLLQHSQLLFLALVLLFQPEPLLPLLEVLLVGLSDRGWRGTLVLVVML